MTSRLKIEDIRNYYGKNINTQEFSELLGLNEKTVKRYISDSILPVAEHHELLGKLLDAEKCHKILVNNDRNNSFTDKNITKRRENYGYITPSQCRALLLKYRKEARNKDLSIKNAKNEVINEPEDDEFSGKMSRTEAESIKQIYLAKQAKLKFLIAMGAVIDKKLVIDHMVEVAIKIQKAVMAIPARVSEIFAGEEDSTKIRIALTEELKFALAKLKFDFEAITKQSSVISQVEDEENGEAPKEKAKRGSQKTKG